MKHVVLPTLELHPVNPGGAGVLIAFAAPLIAETGHRVTLLCDFPKEEVARANELLAADPPRAGSMRAVWAGDLGGGALPGFATPFDAHSEGFARALARLHQEDPIDLIEFPEYAGMGFAALRDRLLTGALARVPIVVRTHGSLELIDRAQGTPANSEQARMYRLERLAMQMADALLTPSQSLGTLYSETYGVASERQVLSPPPMEQLLKGLTAVNRLPDPGHFLFYGKMQEVKGCDRFAEAAVSLVTEQPERGWRFTFVGRDIHCARHGQPTSACLARLIPPLCRDSFEFISAIPRSHLADVASRAIAAVVPSSFETFCLAAHELRSLGVPLIVPRIAAFRDWLHEGTGCLPYDGSANGLRQAMLRMRDEPGLAERLEETAPPAYPPFTAAYLPLLAAPSSSPRADLQLRRELAAMTSAEPGGPT